MATVNVTDENFEAEVIKAGKPVIVDFWAEWCGPCKQIGPILEEISNEMSDVVIAKHNIDNEPNTPTKYGIRGIPTMLLFSCNSSDNSSKIGDICLQGPHHSAQKSHKTIFLSFKTFSSKS